MRADHKERWAAWPGEQNPQLWTWSSLYALSFFFPFYRILRWHVFSKKAELVEVYADAFTAVPYRKRFTPVLCGRITMESSGLKSSISPCSWSASNDCSGAFDQHSGFSSLPLPSPSPTSALVTQLDKSLHYGFRYLNSVFPEEGNYAQPWQYWFWTIKLFREKKSLASAISILGQSKDPSSLFLDKHCVI